MWYFEDHGQPIGPIPEDQVVEKIRAHSIGRHTLVWTEGMSNWTQAELTPLQQWFQDSPPLLPITSVPAQWIDSKQLTFWLVFLLWSLVGFNFLGAIASGLQYQYLQGLTAPSEDLSWVDIVELLIVLPGAAVYVATVVIFGMWIYRANHNARQLGGQDMRFTPGWSVGWYFIPIFNLFRPYQAMKEIWQVSQNPKQWQTEVHGSILSVWWFFWIVSSILARATFRADLKAETLPQLKSASVISLVSSIWDIPLCIVAIMLVRKIFQLQMAHIEPQHAP
jgi:hypothetical protein